MRQTPASLLRNGDSASATRATWLGGREGETEEDSELACQCYEVGGRRTMVPWQWKMPLYLIRFLLEVMMIDDPRLRILCTDDR
jgi:hypothetical protein